MNQNDAKLDTASRLKVDSKTLKAQTAIETTEI